MRQAIFIIFGFCAISSFGQIQKDVNASFNLSQVAMLDLDNNSTVTLNISTPIEAGEKAIVETTDNKKLLKFSSAVTSTAPSRSISIKIDDGQVPSGVYLKLSKSNYVGNPIGKGILGTTAGILTLNNTPQTIISGIRGGFTGGNNNGYELIYYLEIYDYTLLDFNQTATLSITLTLNEFQ